MSKIAISFKDTDKDKKLEEKIKDIEKQDRSYQVKKILYKHFFKEEY